MIICEELLNLFGTSSEELIAKGKKESAEYYLPKINELTISNAELTTSNSELTLQNNHLKQQLTASTAELVSQIDYLKDLLRQHGISLE